MEDEDVHSLFVFARIRFHDEASIATDWRLGLREWQDVPEMIKKIDLRMSDRSNRRIVVSKEFSNRLD
jgi:hypothetical protein